MSITVISNTDPVENAQVAAPSTEEVKQSAPVQETGEIAEESDASEEVDQDTESDEGDESDQEDQEHKDDAKKPVKKNGYQKRISKLNKRASDALAQAEYWKGVAEGKTQKESQPAQQSPAKPEGKPDPNDFETNADYLEALVEWKETAKEAKSKAEQVQKEVKDSQAKLTNDHTGRVKEFMKTATDYNEVVENFKAEHGNIIWPPAIAEALMSSEFGPNILYDVMKKPGEFERFAQMSPVAQIREIGKIEARIADKLESSKSIPPKTTKAPAPLKPVSSGSSGSTKKSIYDPDIDQADYERLRKEQMSRKA